MFNAVKWLYSQVGAFTVRLHGVAVRFQGVTMVFKMHQDALGNALGNYKRVVCMT